MSPKPTDLILHPVRLRILQELAREPHTTAQLTARLQDVPQSSLYRHLRVLRDSEFIETDPDTNGTRASERVYMLKRSTHLQARDLEGLERDDHIRLFTTFLMTLLHEFSLYTDRPQPTDFVADRTGYTQLTVHASDDEWDAAIQSINAALIPLLAHQDTPERTLRKLATVTFPLDSTPNKKPTSEE